MPRALRFALAWLIVMVGAALLVAAIAAFSRWALGGSAAEPSASPTPATSIPQPTSTATAPKPSPGSTVTIPVGLPGVPAPPANAFTATVVWISDGDTIGAKTAERNEIHVRLIGIDSPETKKPNSPVECYGPAATKELTRLIPRGSTIIAAYQDFRIDKYGRDLWDIWLPDGRFVQGAMVNGGFARTLTFGGTNRYAPYLKQVEARAKANRVGMWGLCPQ